MSRIGAYFAIEQGRDVAFWCGTTWVALTVLTWTVVGAESEVTIDAAALLALAVVVVPPAIQIGLPFAVAGAAHRRVESGEWVASRALGRRSGIQLAWVSITPGLALCALWFATHDLVPAAARALRDDAYVGLFDPQRRLDAAALTDRAAVGGAFTGRRILLALDERALAIGFDDEHARSGRFRVLGSGTAVGGRFDEIVLRASRDRRSLSSHGVRELSTTFLRDRGVAWVRARDFAHEPDARDRRDRELRRRSAVTVATAFGAMLGVLPNLLRCPSGAIWRYLGLAAAGAVLAVSVPRLVA